MNRLAYLIPLLCLPLPLLGCPTDVGETGNETNSDDTTGEPTDDPSTTVPTTPATSMTGTATDPTEDTDPTGDTDPTSGTDPTDDTDPTTGPECTDADECVNDEDCPIPGATCVACFCTGGSGCAEWGEGVWGDCLNGEDCMRADAGCVVDNPGAAEVGVCFFPDCESECDCPEPPEGFDDQVTCDALTSQTVDDCFIDCSGGQECPEGWSCVGDFFCGIGEPTILPGYGDCGNLPGTCPETDDSMAAGTCLGIDPAGDMSTAAGDVCSTVNCDDVDDCPDAPATGDAVVTCADVTGDDNGNCTLDCSGGETCPDGMTCHPDFGVCYFEEELRDAYGDCIDEPGMCPGAMQNCLTLAMTDSACTQGCMDTDDCLAEPSGTGDAVIACVDVTGDMAAECILDCSGGETCPDGMACTLDTLCMFPEE